MPDDAADQVDDIRASILGAMEEGETAPAAPRTDAAPEPPAQDRPRGPDGKFAAKQPDDPKPDAPPVDGVQDAAPDKPAEAPKGVEPPANWSAADKAMFKAVPPEAQEFIARRHRDMEADYTRKTQAFAAFRSEYEPVAQAFAPHEAAMRQSGYTPQSLIKAWMGVEQSLMNGKGVDVVADIVRSYGIDKAAVAQRLGLTAQTAAANSEPPPPAVGVTPQLPPEVALKLQGIEQFIAQQQQERQQAAAAAQRDAENRVMSAIETFRTAADANGGLLHPHFSEVEAHMTRLAVAARASGEDVPDLKDLYDQAVWANPSTRAKVLESQTAAEKAQRDAAERKRNAEARAASERARRAGSSVTGAIGNGQAAATAAKGSGASVRDAIMAAMEDSEAA